MNKIFFGVPTDDLWPLCLNIECDEEVVFDQTKHSLNCGQCEGRQFITEVVLKVP